MIGVQLVGADRHVAAADYFAAVGFKKAIVEAEQLGAGAVAGRIRDRAPVVSGRLRDSVKVVRGGTLVAAAYAAAIDHGREIGNVGSPGGNREGPNVIKGRGFIERAEHEAEPAMQAAAVRALDKVIEETRRRFGAF